MFTATAGSVEYLEELRELLGPAPELVDDATILNLVASGGHLLMFRELLKRGCDLESESNGSTALHVAAKNGHALLIAELLEAGVTPTPFDGQGKAPMHLAVSNNHLQAVKQLLSGGAEPDALDFEDQTPLVSAIRDGKPKIAELLIEYGAWVELKTPLRLPSPFRGGNASRVPLLHLACYNSEPECVRVLLENGASPNRKCTISGVTDYTPLHLAYGKPEMLDLLIDAGADLNARDGEGRTTLYKAAERNKPESVETLLARNADTMMPGANGLTPLHIAVSNQFLYVAQILINQDPRTVTAINRQRQTPIFYAARTGDEQMVELLLAAPGADIYLRDYCGWMPIHWAALVRGLAFIDQGLEKYLQSTDPKKGLTHNERKFLLALTASRGNLDAAKRLLKAVINLNVYDEQYGSALQAAVQGGHVNTVEWLMEQGADPTLKDLHGWSPTLCAAQLGNHLLLQLLHKSVTADNVTDLIEHENAKADTRPPTAWSDDKLPDLSFTEDCKGVKNTWSGWVGGLPDGVDPPTPVVRANHPFPARGGDSGCYFEVTIINAGEFGLIEIGVDSGFCDLSSLLGLSIGHSWGYTSQGSLWPPWLPLGDYEGPESQYGTGDVIGCGIDKSGFIFFTKNRRYLGTAYTNLAACRLFPVVCLASPGAEIRVDFSKTWPPDTATTSENTEADGDTLMT